MDDIEPDAIDTLEGRAIYPFGAWGAGYLADAATERRLRAYLSRMTWVIVAFMMLQVFIRHFLVPVPVPELAALAVTLVAFWLFHYAVVKTILREAARASVRPSSRELLRIRVERRGRTAVASGLVSAIVVFGANRGRNPDPCRGLRAVGLLCGERGPCPGRGHRPLAPVANAGLRERYACYQIALARRDSLSVSTF